MAIKILNVGAAAGILSVSFNRGSGGEPGRLIIKKLGEGSIDFSDNAPSDIGGFNIGSGWKLISSMTGEEPGGKITTLEFIDGSYILDKKNIVLFKRNIYGQDEEYDVTETVTIPVVEFNFTGQSGSFTLKTENKDITVRRKRASKQAEQEGILGREKWASNPCESSDVAYKCKDALKLIGIDDESINANIDCQYEGTYRSVLGNIIAKLGKMWYWDNTINKPKIFNSTDSLVLPSLDNDNECKIYSKMSGKTLEGSSSISSWTFKRKSTPTRSAKRTVEVYEYVKTNPVKHPDYPSDYNILKKNISVLDQFDAYLRAGNFDYSGIVKLGYVSIYDFTFNFAYGWSALWLLGVSPRDLAETFGLEAKFDPRNPNGEPDFGSMEFRRFAFSKMGVPDKYWGRSNGLDGQVRIIGAWPQDMLEKSPVTELFYPAPSMNSHKFIGNSANWKTISTEIEPSPERRGLDPYGTTFEDENRIVRNGIWRSPSEYIAEGGDGDDPNGIGSEAWGASVSTSFGGANPDILRYLVDGKENFENEEGLIQSLLDNGMQLFYIVPPAGGIAITPDKGLNVSDLTSTITYENPNEIPAPTTKEQEEDEEKAKEYDDPCEDLIQKEEENANSSDEPIIIGDKDGRSGLVDAEATKYTITVGSPEGSARCTIVTPSLSPMVWKIKTIYEFSVIDQGTTEASNDWTKNGNINTSEDVLNHSVIITEIPTPDSISEEIEVPEASISSGPVSVSEYVVNGFYLPVDDPSLDSLSATLDPEEGLVVSYRYKGLRPEPLPNNIVVSPNSYRININAS